MNDRSLLEQALEAWRVNNAINLKLVNAIPKKGFDAVPLASRGRTVAKQLAHMQKVHSGWLKYNGARLSRDARPLHRNAKLDRKRLAAAFRARARPSTPSSAKGCSRESASSFFRANRFAGCAISLRMILITAARSPWPSNKTACAWRTKWHLAGSGIPGSAATSEARWVRSSPRCPPGQAARTIHRRKLDAIPLRFFFLNTGNVLSSPLRTPRLLCRVLSFPFFRLLNLFPRH